MVGALFVQELELGDLVRIVADEHLGPVRGALGLEGVDDATSHHARDVLPLNLEHAHGLVGEERECVGAKIDVVAPRKTPLLVALVRAQVADFHVEHLALGLHTRARSARRGAAVVVLVHRAVVFGQRGVGDAARGILTRRRVPGRVSAADHRVVRTTHCHAGRSAPAG